MNTVELIAAHKALRCSPDWANPLFGQASVRHENEIAAELLSRGIAQYRPNPFMFPAWVITVKQSNAFAGHCRT